MGKKTRQIDLWKKELELYTANPELVMQANNWTSQQYNDYVQELENKIVLSKRGRGNKVKGSSYEREVAKKYKEALGIELVRTPMSGGFKKKLEDADSLRGDLSCVNDSIDFLLHTECKHHKKVEVRKWLNQAEDDCPKGKYATVVAHLPQVIKEGKVVEKPRDIIYMNLDDFLKLVDTGKVIVPRKVKNKLKKRGVK